MKQDLNAPTLISLHWLPVEFQSQYNIIITVFKALYRMSPFYIQGFVNFYIPARSLHSENSMCLVQSHAQTKGQFQEVSKDSLF